MHYRHFDTVEAEVMPAAAKILIAGGFGVGKTTLVGAISEIRPLRTEEFLSDRSIGIDDISGVDRKTTTTVAMDFGRITFRADLTMYLFGTPGQERFWFMWDDLAYGAVGAVVMADTRRLADCFAVWTTSSTAARPSSSRSTASTAPRLTSRKTSRSPSTWSRARPWCCATRGSATR